MADIMVTVPQGRWLNWLAEGDLPGDPPEESGLWDFKCNSIGSSDRARSQFAQDARVYVVAFDRVRGYAPLVRYENWSLVRAGGAVACTVPEKIPGFMAHRFVDFRDREQPFPTWATEGLPKRLARDVEALLQLRARGPAVRKELRRRALAGLPLFSPPLSSFG